MFFADDAAIVVPRVEASDADAAEALVLRDHPDGSFKAVVDDQVTDEERQRMLEKWMKGGLAVVDVDLSAPPVQRCWPYEWTKSAQGIRCHCPRMEGASPPL